MKILLYLAEVQDFEKTKEREELLLLWAEIHDMQVVGIVCELNDQNCLGIQGLKVIEQVTSILKVEAIAVLTVADISTEEKDAYAKLKVLRDMGLKVASAHNDLPESETIDNESRMRANHCTVKIYENY